MICNANRIFCLLFILLRLKLLNFYQLIHFNCIQIQIIRFLNSNFKFIIIHVVKDSRFILMILSLLFQFKNKIEFRFYVYNYYLILKKINWNLNFIIIIIIIFMNFLL